MNETEALLKIADAINNLAGAISGIGTAFVFFFFFKNMGTSSDTLNKISIEISNAIKSLKSR